MLLWGKAIFPLLTMHSAAAQFFIDILAIVLIDLVLAGDNAVVIALAVKSLPPRERRTGIAIGAALAVVLRVGLTFFASQLLEIEFVKLIGGLLILWIAVKLLAENAGGEENTKQAASLKHAIWLILVADITMSTDNILAVAATSKGHLGLLIFGLGLSIPFVVVTSNFLAMLMDRYPAIVWIGAGILGRVGAEMILTDPYVLSVWNAPSAASIAIQAACVAGVLIAGRLLTQTPGSKMVN
jgi:YjbE family integral membrane protein